MSGWYRTGGGTLRSTLNGEMAVLERSYLTLKGLEPVSRPYSYWLALPCDLFGIRVYLTGSGVRGLFLSHHILGLSLTDLPTLGKALVSLPSFNNPPSDHQFSKYFFPPITTSLEYQP